MKRKPKPTMTMEERFAECHPVFKAELTTLAEANGKTGLEAFTLWRKYSQECQYADQSAIFSEFLSWYRADFPNLPEGMYRLGAA